jgi:chromosome segregation ATPase
MSSSSLPIALGLVGAGLIGGLVAHLFAPTPSVAAGDPAALAPTGATVSPEELGVVQDQLESLTRRLDMLEASDGLAARQPAGESLLGSADLEEAVAAVLQKQAKSSEGMQSIVSDTLESIRLQEAAEKQLAADQRRADALQARIDRLTEELGLYPDQASKMFGVLETEDTKRNELRNSMREGTADFSTVRESMRGLRTDSETAMAEFLTAEQLEKYNETNSSFFGRGGGPGGNSGGGQGGGPGGGN